MLVVNSCENIKSPNHKFTKNEGSCKLDDELEGITSWPHKILYVTFKSVASKFDVLTAIEKQILLYLKRFFIALRFWHT